MTDKFDVTKPVQTRDGRKARIVATGIKHKFPIAAAIERNDSSEFVILTTINGRYIHDGVKSELDLINVNTKVITMWINVYIYINGDFYVGSLFESEEEAKKARGNEHYIATVPVQFEV